MGRLEFSSLQVLRCGVLILAMAVLMPLLSGCGGTKTYPVYGRVELEGEPDSGGELEGYCVTTESIDSTDEQGIRFTANGYIAADGTFRLTTFEPDDGAVAGRHRVAVSAPVQLFDGPANSEVIEIRYGDLSQSGLEITVSPGSNDILLKLKRFGNEKAAKKP